jgi:hypothetical protein
MANYSIPFLIYKLSLSTSCEFPPSTALVQLWKTARPSGHSLTG